MSLRTHRLTDIARRLRREMTDAERLLWLRLRARGIAGAKIRRQAPVGPFVVDFFCAEARLVIEIDGGQHAESRRDAGRDARLRESGFEVVRYWNHEVMRNIDGVLADLSERIAARRPLTPALSPAGERGRKGATGASPQGADDRRERGSPVDGGALISHGRRPIPSMPPTVSE